MTPEYYADLYNRFATYCGGAKYKIAGGPNVDDYNWMKVMMEKVACRPFLVQGISLHNYSFTHSWTHKGDATGFGEAEWMTNISDAYRMQDLLKKYTAIMDKYDPHNKVDLIVDEWGNWFNVEEGTNPGFLYQQNTMRDAITASINLNDFNNYAKRVKMTNIAQMVNVLQAMILTRDDQIVLTPTYYVFKMYSVHQEALLIPSTLSTEDYVFGDKTIPALSSSASVKDGVVNITLSNANPNSDIDLDIDLLGAEVSSSVAQIVCSENMSDYNDFNQSEKVTLSAYKISKPRKGKLSVTIPAHAVVSIQLK